MANSSSPERDTITTPASGAPPETRWSLILRAREADPEALAQLCQCYWKPLYLFARRKGSKPNDAEDLTQGFLLNALTKDLFAKAEREKGRLRSLLFHSFQNFISSEWRRQSSAKRGGGMSPLSIDVGQAEDLLAIDPADDLSPELEFDRHWAREVLAQAKSRVQKSYGEVNKSVEFDAMVELLETGKSTASFREIGNTIGVTEARARFLGFKLRQRFRDSLESIINETVAVPSEAAAELQYLMQVFADPVPK